MNISSAMTVYRPPEATPPPPPVRITFLLRPAVTTGVINLSLLLGSTAYCLVEEHATEGEAGGNNFSYNTLSSSPSTSDGRCGADETATAFWLPYVSHAVGATAPSPPTGARNAITTSKTLKPNKKRGGGNALAVVPHRRLVSLCPEWDMNSFSSHAAPQTAGGSGGTSLPGRLPPSSGCYAVREGGRYSIASKAEVTAALCAMAARHRQSIISFDVDSSSSSAMGHSLSPAETAATPTRPPARQETASDGSSPVCGGRKKAEAPRVESPKAPLAASSAASSQRQRTLTPVPTTPERLLDSVLQQHTEGGGAPLVDDDAARASVLLVRPSAAPLPGSHPCSVKGRRGKAVQRLARPQRGGVEKEEEEDLQHLLGAFYSSSCTAAGGRRGRAADVHLDAVTRERSLVPGLRPAFAPSPPFGALHVPYVEEAVPAGPSSFAFTGVKKLFSLEDEEEEEEGGQGSGLSPDLHGTTPVVAQECEATREEPTPRTPAGLEQAGEEEEDEEPEEVRVSRLSINTATSRESGCRPSTSTTRRSSSTGRGFGSAPQEDSLLYFRTPRHSHVSVGAQPVASPPPAISSSKQAAPLQFAQQEVHRPTSSPMTTAKRPLSRSRASASSSTALWPPPGPLLGQGRTPRRTSPSSSTAAAPLLPQKGLRRSYKRERSQTSATNDIPHRLRHSGEAPRRRPATTPAGNTEDIPRRTTGGSRDLGGTPLPASRNRESAAGHYPPPPRSASLRGAEEEAPRVSSARRRSSVIHSTPPQKRPSRWSTASTASSSDDGLDALLKRTPQLSYRMLQARLEDDFNSE
eukprot:gene5745-4106_t